MTDAPQRLLLAALRRERIPRPPVWLMRQAGRYLPEYQKVRKAAGGFLAMAQNPELAAEVTLQPIRRFGMDGAILFSDILLPLQAMGMPLRFDDGVGPVLEEPLTSPERIAALRPLEPSESLGYVGETLGILARELPESCTLLGFCGAPFTLASYAVEGGTSKGHATLRGFMGQDPRAFSALLDTFADAVGRHLAYQIESGAQAVVLFDTWAGTLGRNDYLRFAMPATERVLSHVRGKAPIINFVLNGGHVLEDIVGLGTEAVAVDWRVSLPDCLARWGDTTAFQGNLDPACLLGTPEDVAARTAELLRAVGGRPGHIFGLGHGVMKQTSPDAVAALVRTVQEHRVVSGSAARV
ncbi:MAG: uroporphyrinogen decarboxylase [Planctomycetota bacterium]|nr:MAG: uroporphyrinogen decarboxylase [Planctomycetota bacterium]